MSRDYQMPWSRWWFDLRLDDYVENKELATRTDIFYMIDRLMSMFEYGGLPDTIPKKFFDYYLFVNTNSFVTDVKDDLYAFVGGLGGEPDAYYQPTIYTVANPYLNISKNFKIGKDGVLVRNDTMMRGVLPLLSKYCSMMAENMLTMRVADINLRVISLLTAPDDATKKACDIYLQDVKDGKIGSIAENRFLDGIKMQSPPSNNGSYLTQFIELHQYLKGSMYNELGLNANFNMKREALGAGESGLNDDILLPFCDDMLCMRKEGLEEINKMFGTHITVDYSSAWKHNMREVEAELENLENEDTSRHLEENGEVEKDEKPEGEPNEDKGNPNTDD